MQVIIESETLRRIRGFTELAPGEVAGMARIKVKNNGELFIHDLKLFQNQKVTSGSVDIDEEQLAIFLSSVDNPEEFKFLWHSHANMQAFLSSIDETYINAVLQTSPYLLSAVSNKKGDLLLRFDGILDSIRIQQLAKLKDKPNDIFNDLNDELWQNIQIMQLPSTEYKETKKRIICDDIKYISDNLFNQKKSKFIRNLLSDNKKAIEEKVFIETRNHPFGCTCLLCYERRQMNNNLSIEDDNDLNKNE